MILEVPRPYALAAIAAIRAVLSNRAQEWRRQDKSPLS
jgi:hypothetical protein